MSKLIQSIIVLVAAIIVVHSIYMGLVWPEANLALEASKQAGQSAPRNLYVILKDYEQEVCIILMIWGIYLIVDKCVSILKDQYLFNVDLLKDSHANKDDLRSVLTSLEELPTTIRNTPLVKTILSSIRRFLITNDVQSTSDAIETSIEALALKQEAENSMIRYLIWAIPSIGFIGTVRGIGEALSQADQALSGNIAGMTDSLGVAFNSTLVALLISIALMFLLHQLQRLQDGLIVETRAYCEAFFLNRIGLTKQAPTETQA